jgi:hypothetical protein|tara:strand:- start:1543 stop:1890 length:348 start_codon:yes stop_codon:yes gene_type:complete
MELTSEFLFQIGAVIASLAGAWALVKNQVSNLYKLQRELKNSIDELYVRTDTNDNSVAVLKNQVTVMTDILSPDNLAAEHRRRGYNDRAVEQLQVQIDKLHSMHNGKHPPVSSKP